MFYRSSHGKKEKKRKEKKRKDGGTVLGFARVRDLFPLH